MSREGWGLSWSTVLGLGPGGIFRKQGQAVFLQCVFLEGVTGFQQPRLGLPGIGTLKDLSGEGFALLQLVQQGEKVILPGRRTG